MPDFLAHVLPPSVTHWDLGNKIQCSSVGLCLYPHPWPDEVSMVVCEIFIGVAMEQGHQAPSHLLPREKSGDLTLDLETPLKLSLLQTLK